MHNLLGGLAYWRGEWDEALVRYEMARDLAVRTGNTVLGAFCTTNIGEIALDRGELDLATSLFRDAARIWRVAGYRSASAFAKLLLGRALGRTGQHAEALALLAESRDESLEVGDHWGALEASARIAGFLLESGEAEEALRLADDALRQTQTLGGVGAQLPLLQRLRGLALAALGRTDDARDAFEESTTAGRARHAGFEIALTTLALAGISDDPDERRAAARRERGDPPQARRPVRPDALRRPRAARRSGPRRGVIVGALAADERVRAPTSPIGGRRPSAVGSVEPRIVVAEDLERRHGNAGCVRLRRRRRDAPRLAGGNRRAR